MSSFQFFSKNPQDLDPGYRIRQVTEQELMEVPVQWVTGHVLWLVNFQPSEIRV